MIASFAQEEVALSKLTGAEYNPRDMSLQEMERLKTSLREFGFVQPIVARREDGLVIGGHQRLEAYRQILLESGTKPEKVSKAKVPVVFVDGLDDTKTKLLNLALNKISGEWDYAKLADMFASLPEDVAQMSGFSAVEIDNIMSMLSGPAALTPAADLDKTIEDGLAAQARQFRFGFDSDEEAKLCDETLRAYGMTGPGNASVAFLAAMKAAKGALAC